MSLQRRQTYRSEKLGEIDSMQMRRMAKNLAWAAFSLALMGLMSCGPQKQAGTETVEEFYRGKVLSIVVGAGTGGQYDFSARAVAHYLPKYIPGHPQIIVQNMPGGGGLVAANYVFHVAPKDGTVFGIFTDATLLAPIWQFDGVKFDSRKVNWLGAIGDRDASVAYVRSDAPATTLDGITRTEITVGSSGPTSSTTTYALLMNELIGTKFKVIVGYPGASDVRLALERGEIDGRVAGDWTNLKLTQPDWITSKFVLPVAQLTLKPIKGLEGVPMVIDMARNDDDRRVMEIVLGNQELHHLYATAGDIEPARVAALRKALHKMMDDPGFIAEITKTTSMSLRFSDYQKIDAFLAKAYALPEKIRTRAARYLGGE